MTLLCSDPDVPVFTRRYVNLADSRFGAQALEASDDFFAPKERLLSPEPAVFIPAKHDDNGKWMDGWETRRKRIAGHDWCIVKLARPGVIVGFDIDTSHFTGNFPPAASIEAAYVAEGVPNQATRWIEIAPSTPLQGNHHHYIEARAPDLFTHVRLNMYPDGGIARLRVYGQPRLDWSEVSRNTLLDLAAMENGGCIVAANDEHYGLASNMLLPGRGESGDDGWQTRRRREPGNDWTIIALAQRGVIQKIEVDTAYFKGNYPDRCSLQAACMTGATTTSLITQSMFWPMLLDEQKLHMDKQHFFEAELAELGPVTHVRLNIIPDGGISRLRLWGMLEK